MYLLIASSQLSIRLSMCVSLPLCHLCIVDFVFLHRPTALGAFSLAMDRKKLLTLCQLATVPHGPLKTDQLPGDRNVELNA